MTDLHIYARREGLRDTEWERPGELYDWGNNRALVLMKSFDLVNWTHTIYHVGEKFGKFKDAGCLWAPRMIFDPQKRRMMVFFTTRFGKGRNKLYYAYADPAFTKFETEPEEPFAYPRDRNIIDSDITKAGNQYHLFYVTHGQPGVWKRTGTDTYVLVYDVFGVNPHNFGFSETTDFKTFKSIGRFNEGVMKTTNFTSPKHGAIIPRAPAEARAPAKRWKCDSWERNAAGTGP